MLDAQEEPKEVYTNTELLELVKKPNIKSCTFQEFRTWAIVNFYTGTGCRVGTLVRILIKDIDWDNHLIQYRHTKNKSIQYMPITLALERVLKDYLATRCGEPDSFLFPSENDKQLVETTVTHNIKTYLKKREA